jgi:hypothetical protein
MVEIFIAGVGFCQKLLRQIKDLRRFCMAGTPSLFARKNLAPFLAAALKICLMDRALVD